MLYVSSHVLLLSGNTKQEEAVLRTLAGHRCKGVAEVTVATSARVSTQPPTLVLTYVHGTGQGMRLLRAHTYKRSSFITRNCTDKSKYQRIIIQ
jgi:hypothetical protein